MTPGVCIHTKALCEKHKVSFCYELLVPPNPVPILVSLIPSHKLYATNTRSLQIGMAGALNLVQKCEEAYNHSYQIALSPQCMETVPQQHACLSNKRILLIVQARK